MDIRGRDPDMEGYRIAVDVDGREVVALLPERFAAGLGATARPSHETAYHWIAAHQNKIEHAIARLSRGQHPRAPYDQITLLEEN